MIVLTDLLRFTHLLYVARGDANFASVCSWELELSAAIRTLEFVNGDNQAGNGDLIGKGISWSIHGRFRI